jgi:hypothetical protein
MTSRSALITVLRLIPDASATAVLPPRPSISATDPRHYPALHLVHVREHDTEEAREPCLTDLHTAIYYARTNMAWTLSLLNALSIFLSSPTMLMLNEPWTSARRTSVLFCASGVPLARSSRPIPIPDRSGQHDRAPDALTVAVVEDMYCAVRYRTGARCHDVPRCQKSTGERGNG